MTKELFRDIKATFEGDFEPGKRVLEWLSFICNEHIGTFDEKSERQTCYNEGAREVILRIRRVLNMKLNEPENEKIEGNIV